MRPLGLFHFVLRPAITALNALGHLTLRLFGLHPGTTEQSLHSPEELKLLVAASQKAGLLDQAQQEVVECVFNIGDRDIADIMTPPLDVDWVDADDSAEAILRTIRESRHEQLLVGRGGIDEPLGMVVTKEHLDQVLDGKPLDPMAVIREPRVAHEATSTFRALDLFKKTPVRLALVIDEYGSLNGIVTQTGLLEAIAGGLPGVEREQSEIVTCEDGSLLIDGMTAVHEAFSRLGFSPRSADGDFHTIAGFALAQLRHIPNEGEHFSQGGWRFDIADMDGRRIKKLLVRWEPISGPAGSPYVLR